MEKEKIKIILDLVVVAMLFIVSAILIMFLITVYTEGGQCILNPAGYYAEVNNISNICKSCFSSFKG